MTTNGGGGSGGSGGGGDFVIWGSSQSVIAAALTILTVVYLFFYLSILYTTMSPAISSYTKVVDTTIFGLFFLVSLIYYSTFSHHQKYYVLSYILLETRNFFDSIATFVFSIVGIILLFIITYVLQIPMTYESKPSSITFIEYHLWVFIGITGIVQFFQFFFQIGVMDDVYDFIVKYLPYFAYPDEAGAAAAANGTDDDDNNSDDGHDSDDGKKNDGGGGGEVFHVSNNLYTYEDAGYVCQALDAQLATYDQVEDAYNRGAEWCGYGWSEGQMALFPTQKATWEKMQAHGPNNDCGRPGINGGVISNPKVRFGVNCYGRKPEATQTELDLMQNCTYRYPQSQEDQANEAKLEFWRKNRDNLLVLDSFNQNQWSEY